jgi:hypothetical protein
MTRRRSDRIYVQVPVRLSGKDRSGAEFEEETVTVNINRHGACITLTQFIEPEQSVRVKNLRNGLEQDFRVVGLVRQVFGNRAEWGLELTDPEIDFWGVEFVPPPESVEPKILLQCMACSKVLLGFVSRLQFDMLMHTGLISRHCEQCGETTRWQPSEPELPPEIARRISPPEHERRKNRRLRIAMHLRLTGANGESEIVQTADASKGGLCFFSKKPHAVGEWVSLILPYGEGGRPSETLAKVVWAREVPGGKLYGASYAASDFALKGAGAHMAHVA